jgi:threonine dehydrogenase-like Zn-dependent dehydrogenase
MRALEVYRSLPRYAAARVVTARLPGLAGTLAPLRLVDGPDPAPPAEGWVRVRPRLSGICGSDLATLSGAVSLYFSALVSLPFVPGHEVVGDLADEAPGLPRGSRVVVDPVLGCATRGITPACSACAAGRAHRCARVTAGHLAPGLQTGYCRDTGGGWAGMLTAHPSQLHPVPEDLPDERAVLVEPLACAAHVAARVVGGAVHQPPRVVVVGAGVVGLLTCYALRVLTGAAEVTVVAKHPAQAELARRMGASAVVGPDAALGALRRATRALRLVPERGADFLLGGVDVAVDAVGSRTGFELAARCLRAGGRLVAAALPPAPPGGPDLAPVWFRELEVVGVYAAGPAPDDRPAFDVALELAADPALGGLVGARYPLHRWREALDHAFSAGRLGTAKVVFDPRSEA